MPSLEALKFEGWRCTGHPHDQDNRTLYWTAVAPPTLRSVVSVDLQLESLTNRYYGYAWYGPDGAKASLHSPGDGYTGPGRGAEWWGWLLPWRPSGRPCAGVGM